MKDYSKLTSEVSLAISALSAARPSAGKSLRSPISGTNVAGRNTKSAKTTAVP